MFNNMTPRLPCPSCLPWAQDAIQSTTLPKKATRNALRIKKKRSWCVEVTQEMATGEGFCKEKQICVGCSDVFFRGKGKNGRQIMPCGITVYATLHTTKQGYFFFRRGGCVCIVRRPLRLSARINHGMYPGSSLHMYFSKHSFILPSLKV